MKRYVCGEKEQIVLDGKRKRLDSEDKIFAREAEGFLYLSPEFGEVELGFPDDLTTFYRPPPQHLKAILY